MRTHVTRRSFTAASAAVFATVSLMKGRARAADFVLKLGTSQANGAPLNVRGTECADRIRKESNGRVDLQMFPNNVLGGLSNQIEQTRAGAIQFVMADGITLSTVVPLVAMNSVGWSFKDSAQGLSAFDGELGNYVRNDIRSKGMYCHDKTFLIGMKNVTSTPRAIVSPDDFHGFKIRVPPGALAVDLFSALGASVATMNVNEVYTALQTHVVDGEENPLVNIEFQRFYEVQKYLSITYHMFSGLYLIGNQATWSSIPSDLQGIINRNFAIYAAAQNKDVEQINDGLVDKLRSQGMTVNRPDPRPFRAQLGGFYQKWKKEFGPTGWALLERSVGRLG